MNIFTTKFRKNFHDISTVHRKQHKNITDKIFLVHRTLSKYINETCYSMDLLMQPSFPGT